MTTFMQKIINMDTNGDGVVSLREFIEIMQVRGFMPGVSADDLVATNGEDFDWVNDHHLIAEMLASGVDTEDYYSLYGLMELLGMPWMTDEYF